jgi:hypothetical protein
MTSRFTALRVFLLVPLIIEQQWPIKMNIYKTKLQRQAGAKLKNIHRFYV